MPVHERFLVLVPAAVTVIVVLVVDRGATMHGGLLPFAGQALNDAWHVLTNLASFGARG